MNRTLVVARATHAVVQDLGRPGYAGIGVSPNGASDQHAARTANVLVGNAQGAALVEVTGSELVIRCATDTLVAVTGAAEVVLVDGHPQPAWEPVPVPAGCAVGVPAPVHGLRSYLALNGTLDVPTVLGSVGPDPLLGVGRRLHGGDRLVLHSAYAGVPGDVLPLFRLGARRPVVPADGVAVVAVTPGPDLDRLEGARLDGTFTVMPDSDTVGLRLDGPPVTLRASGEILSRGVPVGAVQVTHSGGVVVLLRGRLVTAGYPVVAVATTAALDTLGQLRPGDRLRLSTCTTEEAVDVLRSQARQRHDLAARVRTALTARGLGRVLHPAPPALSTH